MLLGYLIKQDSQLHLMMLLKNYSEALKCTSTNSSKVILSSNFIKA